MTKTGIIATALLALLSGARAEETEATAREPYQLVRALQALQDSIASGNLEAHNAQTALLKRLGENSSKPTLRSGKIRETRARW